MTRIDHTGHDHSNTTAARTSCRTRRNTRIREAQNMFMVLPPGDIPAWDEYNATVELLGYALGVSHEEAYVIVEDGPIITP